MFHIHNGDSTAGTMRESGFPGEHFAFREALASGPAPRGLLDNEWVEERAAHLARLAGVAATEIRKEWAGIEAMLSGSASHDEVVLWFEHDLHCQINLIYLLTRFARRASRSSRLSLICIGTFPGFRIFHGLGELTGEQLASLFGSRHTVTNGELQLARRAWDAYTAADPRDLQTLLAGDTAALPFLRDALLHHLGRFPSTGNGLGAIENRALQLISEGHAVFRTLYPAFSDADPIYGGLGDLILLDSLRRVAASDVPLLLMEGDGIDAKFTLTNTGAEVLACRRNYLEINSIDMWLGGVHLTSDNHWRWDETECRLQSHKS